MRSALGFFSVFAIVVAGLLLLVGLIAPEQFQSEDQQSRLVYLLLLLVLIGGGTFSAARANITVAIRQALIWLAIFLLVVLAYSFRAEFAAFGQRVKAELAPSMAIEIDQEDPNAQGISVALRKSADGHFHANARVNNAHVRFLVDTGASSIALTIFDAKRVGIDLDTVTYNIPVNTASGQTFGAYVQLDKVSIGKITLRDVDAIIIKEGLSTSLLGMSFLGRLQKFEASRNQLILKK